MRKRMDEKIIIMIAVLLLSLGITGCNSSADVKPPSKVGNTENQDVLPDPVSMKIATLKGPTGLGLVSLMEQNSKDKAHNDYTFETYGSPEEIVGKIVTGEVDAACVPTNLAATLYQKTEGKVQIAAINTLGVLYILDSSGEIKSISDLQGKTIYATGKGSTPEFVLNYILERNGLFPGKDVIIEYKTDHSELAALCASGQISLAMLPEPNVTTVLSKNEAFQVAIDITAQWDKANANSEFTTTGTIPKLAMGSLIVSKEFAEKNKAAFNEFLNEYEESINYVNDNVKKSAALSEKYQIIPSSDLAEKAIPSCNIVFITGDSMISSLKPFYDVLGNYDLKSIGGKIPDDTFYYKK